jgi:aminopeptidase-like protein
MGHSLAPDPTGEQTDAAASAGEAMFRLIEALFPICRSITGDGVRQTLRILQRQVPLQIREVPSGTEVFDWKVPQEWNVREAYIETLDGRRVVDFADCNLHLLQYSVPVNRVVPLEELRQHLYSLPEAPDWIPYRTAYYANTWGFCVAHRQLEQLTDPQYRVVIGSTLADGSMTYGELLLPGETADEVLITAHVCHPSLANDNLSGLAVATALAARLSEVRRRYSYRFLFAPGTIGSISWLAHNKGKARRIRYGLVLSCVGDAGRITYKQSRRGDAEIDRFVEHVLRHGGEPYQIMPFIPYGYDERQYCSPGFNLPVGCFTRSPNGMFDEYHTSADNLELVRPVYLEDSLEKILQVIDLIEHNGTYRNTQPYCEPQLGKRGLYRAVGGQKDGAGYDQMSLLWVLNLSDGEHSLFEIAERAGQPFADIRAAADALAAKGLLVPAERARGDHDRRACAVCGSLLAEEGRSTRERSLADD